ncbi:hypothetical protein CLOM_g13140 [Closterium sp. NIES-68]|nr:hypothetical protein CLOM_g13140 [Closterium sp. NIES-68]
MIYQPSPQQDEQPAEPRYKRTLSMVAPAPNNKTPRAEPEQVGARTPAGEPWARGGAGGGSFRTRRPWADRTAECAGG